MKRKSPSEVRKSCINTFILHLYGKENHKEWLFRIQNYGLNYLASTLHKHMSSKETPDKIQGFLEFHKNMFYEEVNLISFHSTWAKCLDDDEMSYMRDIVNITGSLDSLDDKVASNLNNFDEVMEVMANRPKQPTAKDYQLRESRRDINKLGVIITCLQKKGTFPLPKEDLSFLCNVFFKHNNKKTADNLEEPQ